ncbi:DUF72 domain-containing protein [Synechococcus sp. PCC 7336]|uniref:DUF72 domain-containing protein n=1 Tax=Synechococcus sp. PCC 7336 TaxID=195250 RepID=UPI00034C877A|nr:DUF72 domain-containing protein [Synechococcus sp. PCC 7336]
MHVGRFYLGCAVWAYRGWVRGFYPEGSRSSDFLSLYGDRLTAVEGNTTFYSVPDVETVRRWAAATPSGFRFCPKLPRTITHQGQLEPLAREGLAFLERMQGLGDRLGPMFAQLPPSYSPVQLEDLEAFLAVWPCRTAPLAIEVRHPDWFEPTHTGKLDRLLAQAGVGRVLLDTRPIYSGSDDPQVNSQRRKPNLPLQPRVTASFAIVRLISHPDRDRNTNYLDEWAQRVSVWLQQGIDVFFFVHCPQEQFSPGTAKQFQQRLENESAPVPPLPWDGVAGKTSGQLSLF